MKSIIKPVTLAATVAVVLISSGLAQARPHQALSCKSWVSGSGQALIKPIAQSKARSNWKSKVSGLYGPSWTDFSLAKVGAFPCNKVGAKWSCTVRAKPCKKIGFGSGKAN